MEYTELIAKRRSCRKFSNRAIEPEVLAELIAEAEYAPMAGNRRGDRRLLAVTERDLLRKMGQIVRKCWEDKLRGAGEAIQAELLHYGENFYHFAEAPAVIFLAARREPDFVQAIMHETAERFHGNAASVLQSGMLLQLSAENRGLGSCMMTGPLIAEQELKIELGLSKRWKLFGIVSIGYKLYGGG
jgi:nitroreductase